MKGLAISLATLFALTAATDALSQAKKKPERQAPTTSKSVFAGEKYVAENWQDFQQDAFKLTVAFPKKPDVSAKSDVDYTEQGFVPIQVTTVETYLNKTYYLVNVRSYPEGFLGKRTDLAANFGAWLKLGILRGIPVLGERQIAYDKYLMLEFLYRPSEREIVVHRCVVIGDRLYQMLIQFPIDPKITPEKAVENNASQIRRFFDSFHVKIDPTAPNRSVG